MNHYRRMLSSLLLACASTAFGADGLTNLQSLHAARRR